MVRKTPQAAPGIQDRGSESSPAPASSPAGPECSCPPQSRPRRRDSEDSPDLQKGNLSAGRQEGSGSWPLPLWCLREASVLSGVCAKMWLLSTARRAPWPRGVALCSLYPCAWPPQAGAIHRYAHAAPTRPRSFPFLNNLRTKECQKW